MEFDIVGKVVTLKWIKSAGTAGMGVTSVPLQVALKVICNGFSQN